MNYVQDMAEARCHLTESIAKWNASQRESNKELERVADKECEDAKAAFNKASKMAFYEKCFDTADPLYEAIEMLTYQSIGWSESQPKESQFVERKIKEGTTVVRLDALNKYAEENVGRHIGAETDWKFAIEKFNQLMTFYAAQQLGIDPKSIADSYRISELARQVELGKTPTSNTQVLKELQQIIEKMLGKGDEERKFNATSHDANYVQMTFARTSKAALAVKAKNPKQMYETVAQVCHRIVTGKNYKLEYYSNKR